MFPFLFPIADIVQGNKNSVMRLLLAISASFMPSHIHDIKHEIRDRHAVFGGQKVWVGATISLGN